MKRSSSPDAPKTQADRRRFVAGAASLLSASSLAGCAATAGQPAQGGHRRFEFALIGDMPYNRAQEAEYDRVMQELNARELAFVAHIGDFQFDPRPYERDPSSARMPGDDATYDYVLKTFGASRNPLVVTPGDNDWADLFEMRSRTFDPLERLRKVRSSFYPPGSSLGQRKMPLASQADVDGRHAAFRENQAWSLHGIEFATAHIIGSNDNVGRSPAMDAEQLQRKAANLDWIKRAFAQARERKALGLVLIIHANLGFENLWPSGYLGRYYRPLMNVKAPAKVDATAYDDYIKLLSTEMETFKAPTLLLHGDTHLFRIDKPLFSARTQRPFENFTRIETFGWPDTHWVHFAVDPEQPQVFTITPRLVPGNQANHRAG